MSDFANDVASKSLAMSTKSIEAFFKMLQSLIEREDKRVERKIKKEQLKEYKIGSDRREAIAKISGKTGYVNAKILRKTGEECTSIKASLTSKQLKRLDKLAKKNGIVYSSISDQTIDGKKDRYLMFKNKDSDVMKYIFDQLTLEAKLLKSEELKENEIQKKLSPNQKAKIENLKKEIEELETKKQNKKTIGNLESKLAIKEKELLEVYGEVENQFKINRIKEEIENLKKEINLTPHGEELKKVFNKRNKLEEEIKEKKEDISIKEKKIESIVSEIDKKSKDLLSSMDDESKLIDKRNIKKKEKQEIRSEIELYEEAVKKYSGKDEEMKEKYQKLSEKKYSKLLENEEQIEKIEENLIKLKENNNVKLNNVEILNEEKRVFDLIIKEQYQLLSSKEVEYERLSKELSSVNTLNNFEEAGLIKELLDKEESLLREKGLVPDRIKAIKKDILNLKSQINEMEEPNADIDEIKNKKLKEIEEIKNEVSNTKEFETINKLKEELVKDDMSKINDNNITNIIDEKPVRLDFSHALNRYTDNINGLLKPYYIVQEDNPCVNIKVTPTHDYFQGKKYLKSYFELSNGSKYNDGRFVGRGDYYWVNLRKQMKSELEMSDEVLVFNSRDQVDRYIEEFNRQNKNELTFSQNNDENIDKLENQLKANNCTMQNGIVYDNNTGCNAGELAEKEIEIMEKARLKEAEIIGEQIVKLQDNKPLDSESLKLRRKINGVQSYQKSKDNFKTETRKKNYSRGGGYDRT